MFNQAEWEKYGRSMGEVSLETVPLNIQTYFTYFTCSCDKFIVCTYILHYIYIIYIIHIYIYIHKTLSQKFGYILKLPLCIYLRL